MFFSPILDRGTLLLIHCMFPAFKASQGIVSIRFCGVFVAAIASVSAGIQGELVQTFVEAKRRVCWKRWKTKSWRNSRKKHSSEGSDSKLKSNSHVISCTCIYICIIYSMFSSFIHYVVKLIDLQDFKISLT